MPTIFAGNDGILGTAIMRTGQSTFEDARDNTTGTFVQGISATSVSLNMASRFPSRGGGFFYGISRIYMWFDTTSITVTPASATFSIQRTTLNPTANFRFIKSTAFGNSSTPSQLTTSEFGSFPGFSVGSTMEGNVTDYTDSTTPSSAWGTSNAYNTTAINLNSNALSDMASNDFLIIAMVDYDYDYQNVDPGINFSTSFGYYTPTFSGTSRDPKIDYVAGAAGYGKDVIGVASDTIVEVSGVATADIVDVIGVS